jgi:hypothetical protein
VTKLAEFAGREEQYVMIFFTRQEARGGVIKIATTEEAISEDPYLVQVPCIPSEFKHYDWVATVSMKIATALALNGWILGTITNPYSHDNRADASQKGPFTVRFGRRLL